MSYSVLESLIRSRPRLRTFPPGTVINAVNFSSRVVPGASVVIVVPVAHADFAAAVGTVKSVSGGRRDPVVVTVEGKDYSIRGWSIYSVISEGGILGAYHF